ncbi:kinesin-like protein [Phytophthora infestans T30-4]|uniref:Kinesin-like protein n=1 Tax=Phytophthora infestans (strain T30-4) TaxID=403677 RepID=D0P1F2_PHYIT|nr:kinesin-like protein [Phytophthora infestans T30-4]EEY54186.1 kinesin-like protein [Phytophthora infestans T30-4]|eukprot:XP_002895880.1 kinesin-like protein [Phytophthora infestans T30-4]
MLPRELARNAATCRKFTFDHVFPQTTTQAELYDEALQPWMASFLQGFNVTVIAYGQTGSGKTHTMGNHMPSTSLLSGNLFTRSPSTDDSDDEAADTLESDEGLIPRFLHQLFTKLNDSGSKFQLSVSFLEIYGEDIHDLLDSGSSRRSEPLQLRENKKNGVWVQGLAEVRVATRQEALEQMRRGSLQRITASTQMNERSSRSHAVYTVKIVQRVSEQGSKKDAVIVSKLTFVDLAGSERLKKTHAEGERMKEGIQINVGLFALGNVINALGEEKRRSASHAHVPYRSSKLTRLLQDALGGNSRTLFIACVSPADSNTNETLNTLQYANRAKNIQNKAVKNIDSRSAELVSLKSFNQLLCRELVKAILGDEEDLVETCLMNPKVLAYLNSIEQLSSSTGLETSSDERVFETRRLVDGLTTYLQDLVPSGLDFTSDSGSSVAIMEERRLECDVFERPYPLSKLCRTLEIMNAAFEMQEMQHVERRQRELFKAKLANLETRFHRQELLRTGLSGMMERMRTWLSSSASSGRTTVERNLEDAVEKLELLDLEMADMQRRKEALTSERETDITRCRNEWTAKQAQIERMRDAPEEAATNGLNMLTRRTEIKVRFDGYDLDDISEFLKDEEKEVAACMECDDAGISLMSPLFTQEELGSSQSREIVSMIQGQLQIAFDKEALEASMNKELRKRAQLFQNITTGLMACERGAMTEQEFMEKNEQDLRDCEDSIAQLRDAMRAQRDQRASMSEILDSIKSLDVAKNVIKRLVVEIYSQWRMYMACDQEEDLRKQREAEEALNQSLAQLKAGMDEKVETLEEKYTTDVQCAFQMVTSFNDAVAAEKRVQVEADTSDVVALEERERMLMRQLAEKDEQVEAMRVELERFQASAKSTEMKEESFRLMTNWD